MDRLLRDLRYAGRLLRRAPGSTAVALATLALATGLSTSIFTLVNAISLRPLPYTAPNELLQLSSMHRETGAFGNMSGPDALDVRARSRTLSDLVLYDERVFGVRIGAAAEEMTGNRLSGNAFTMLGGRASVGRTLTPEDGRAGAPDVVVISYQLWHNRLGHDPGVIGRTLRIDGVLHEIIGVMPERFGFHDFAEFWIPLRETALGDRATRGFQVMSRRRPDVTPEQVAQELAQIDKALAAEYPATRAGWVTHVSGLQDTRSEPFIYAMVVAALFVLLIACANIGNLLLARGAARRAELAVRLMMGASRGRVLRQLLTESAVLAVVGSLAGLIVSLWGIDLLIYFLPIDQMPLWIDFGIDGRVLGFTIAAMVLSVLTFGLVPALSVMRGDLGAVAREAGRRTAGTRSTTRTRNVLVVAELALSLILLASAGLMLRGTAVSANASPGFDPAPVLHLNVPLNPDRYATDAARVTYVDDALRALQAIGNVESAGVLAGLSETLLSPGAAPTVGALTAAGASSDAPASVLHTAVSSDLFAALQLPVLRGRAFTDADRGASVVILSKTVAERLWPGADPIGRTVKFGPADHDSDWLTVVGVLDDRYRIAIGEGGDPRTVRLDVYVHASQGLHRDLTFLVRARDGQPLQVAEAARRALQGVDADQPIVRVRPYADIVYDNVRVLRWLGTLAGTFAFFALLLSAIGLFGVIAYSVTQRTREIGIRVALGARPGQVVGMVTSSGVRLAVIGVGIGLLGTLASAKLLASVMFGVSPYNPLVLATVAGVLGGVAIAASWLPARRAARVNPLVALQAE